jgi:hypothetical protein
MSDVENDGVPTEVASSSAACGSGAPYLPAATRASLRQVGDPLEILLSRRRNVVGRSPRADLTLSDSRVSRSHAVIEQVGSDWTIADLGSTNGSYVNGVRVDGLMRLCAGDEIVIGNTRLVVHVDSSPDDDVTEATEAAPRLTARERDVVVALLRKAGPTGAFVQAATAVEIATMLGVSTAAVHQHLVRLYQKFGIHGASPARRTRLANEALRRGAVTLAETRATDRPPVGR